MKFLKDLLTEPNNETYCLVKTIAATGTLVFFWCSVTHVIANHTFSFTDFGVGLGSIMAGAGGALLMKKDTPK